MEIYALLALMATHFIALLVPGPDVFLVMRTSLAHGFSSSVFACIGVGFGVVIWVVLTAFGLKSIFALYPPVQLVLMAFSVCYLLYLAYALYRSARSVKNTQIQTKSENLLSPKRFFMVGFLTNLSNPKAVLYFASVFSKFIDTNATIWQIGLLVGIISIQSVVVFVLLGKIFSVPLAREKFMQNQRLIDAICSAIFALFAVLILSDLITQISASF